MPEPCMAELTRKPDPLESAASEMPPSLRRKGRGATLNLPSRFDRATTVAAADGWELPGGTEPEQPLATTLIRDATRGAISWNGSPDIGFDRAVNPYRGCEHGCVYCYARPTHAYLGYSPGLDFETKLVYKPEGAELLRRELGKPGYVARPLALGSNTDPYQPIERTLRLTRAVLQVLDQCNHPVSIVTKSASVLSDLGLLSSMARRNLVRVWVSVTTLDAGLARTMEPRASTPANRLRALRELAQAGVATGAAARNWASYGAEVALPDGLPGWRRGLLCDPQTRGGLLLAAAPEAVGAVLHHVRAAGFAQAAVVGTMEAGTGIAVIE